MNLALIQSFTRRKIRSPLPHTVWLLVAAEREARASKRDGIAGHMGKLALCDSEILQPQEQRWLLYVRNYRFVLGTP